MIENNINGENELIGALSSELIRVRALNEQILRKAQDLRQEIGVYESRLEYAGWANLEAENIAREIELEARARVHSIVEGAQQVVKPLYEQIVDLQKEIVTLAQEIDIREERNDTTPDPLSEIQSSLEEFNWQTGSQGHCLQLVAPPAVNCESSSVEPQQQDLGWDDGEPGNTQPNGIDTVPKDNNWASLPSKADELPAEGLLDSEVTEPDLHFEFFVDARHFETVAGQTEPVHSHGWQIEIEVGVPDSSYYYGGYSKVSQAIDSTLLRYDGQILNQVFPFTLLEPSLANVAGYFFNCLDNMLSLMDLVLKEVTVGEDSDSSIKVTTRNAELDDLLHKGEDFLEDFRSRLCADNQSPKSSTSLIGKLEQMFKLTGWSASVKN